MPRIGTHLTRSALTIVVAVFVLAGCSGGGQGTTPGTDTTSPLDPAVAPSVTPPSPDPSPSGLPLETTIKPTKVRLERPSGTPLGQVIPAGDNAYLLLSQGRCADLLRATTTWRKGDGNQVNEDAYLLYKAAAEACLGRWDDAQRDAQRLARLQPQFSGGCDSQNCERCMRAVKAWLDQILALRGQQPTAEVEQVKGTKASPCPAPGAGTPDDQQTTTTRETSTTVSPRSTSSGPTTTTRR